MTDESDEDEGGSASTRRQVLRAAGALGLAGALGATGWTARVVYLNGVGVTVLTSAGDELPESRSATCSLHSGFPPKQLMGSS